MPLTRLPLTTGVSGTLAAGNGGTGVTSADAIGNLVLLSSTTLNADTEVIFNNTIITSTYKSYIIRGVKVHSSTDNNAFYFRVSDDNGSSFKNSDYKRSIQALVVNLDSNTFISRQGSADGQGTIAGIYEGIGNDTGEAVDFELKLFDPLANSDTHFMVQSLYQSNNGRQTLNHGFGIHGVSSIINAVRIFPSGGNFAEGTISIYGVRT